MTQLKHYDNLNSARFVTFSCYHRYQLLNDNHIKDIICKHLKEVCEKYDIKILGYVLMPEHIHLVLYPQIDLKLGKVVGEIKSKSAREILELFQKNESHLLVKLTFDNRRLFWQKRCYDHNCRTLETVIEKINYCHKNPVARRLVSKPEDWRYSSYRWYHKMSDIVLDIDGVEI